MSLPLVDVTSAQSLSSTNQKELLDVVDSLRAEGLSDFTALPQLIVCGDQSSGKSSCLQAISGVPFPRKDNLCTRFATEVILRRVHANGLVVSIKPGIDRSAADRDRLLNFRHALHDDQDLTSVFEKATEAMGLTTLGGAFTKDILRIEISGPLQPQLTIVDLPGLIHSESRSQTAEDVKLVTELVRAYMENPRSIILAVVSAKNDFANQIILQRARALDAQGLRTLGIITKPDTLVPGSDSEKAYISLARNEQVTFKLGWHVVKNQDFGSGELDFARRDAEETEYFEGSNFKALSASSRGVAQLKIRLSKVLFGQIQEQLPSLIVDISKGNEECLAGLERLGEARVTIDEQRTFLFEFSQTFQDLCRDAINGHYDDPFFGNGLSKEGEEKRLRSVVRNKQIDFADAIRTKGRRWIISEDHKGGLYRTKAEAVAQVLQLLKRSRGRELPGLPNPLLVGEVFREYSEPWEKLAQDHILEVWNATKAFLERVLEHLTDSAVADMLLRLWLDPLSEKFLSHANTKLKEVIAVRLRDPVTTNHYFRDTVCKIQFDRHQASFTKRLQDLFNDKCGEISQSQIGLIVDTAYPKVDADMDKVAAEDIFDSMMAFYKVSF